jgi:hypothetical protein
MNDDDYQAALKREAAWLDEQIEAYVAAKRSLPSGAADGASNSASFRTDDAAATGSFDTPGLRFEDKPLPASGAAATPFTGTDQPAQTVPELGMAQPPQPSALSQRLGGFSGIHAVLLTVFLAVIGFGIWQAVQANNYKAQANKAAENVQKWAEAQTALDDALCDAGYPAIIAAIQKKTAAKTALTDSEKAILAFGDYRTATPNIANDGYRVDADPPCAQDSQQDAAQSDGGRPESAADRPTVGAP